MAKPFRNRSTGIMVLSNGWPLSRLASVDTSADLNEEIIEEIGNEEVVERVDQTPTVTVSIEGNEYASMRNLRFLTAVTGGNITIDSFDGPTCDIQLLVEEDKVFLKNCVINNAVVNALSWNFDVGGLATESYTIEGDNWTWFQIGKRNMRVFNALASTTTATGATGRSTGHIWIDVRPTGVSLEHGVHFTTGWDIYKIYDAGVDVAGTYTPTADAGSPLVRIGSTQFFSLTNDIRVLAYQDTGTGTPPTRVKSLAWGVTESIPAGATRQIGGVSKGMIDVILATGGYYADLSAGTNFLRLQTCSIDVDLSRDSLEELGHDRAFVKSLVLPVDVNITFSAIGSDLAEWSAFQGHVHEGNTGEVFPISAFTKTAELTIAVYDKKDVDRTLVAGGAGIKKYLITGLDVSALTYSVNVGENATQDFTVTASNLTITGAAFTSWILK